MKTFRPFLIFTLILGCLWTAPLGAQESPEAVYAKWVAASKAGDINALLAISSAAKVREYETDVNTPEKKAEVIKFMTLLAPIKYQVKKTEISKDGNKASLFLDATAIDFFSMNDKNAKPTTEFTEVRLVKEGGVWKIDQQCMGKDGCGKEPEWTQIRWGQSIPMGQGSLKFVKGKAGTFKGIPVKGQAFVAQMVLSFPQGSETISWFVHRNPSFADFFVKAGEEKVTPIAEADEFPATLSTETPGPEVKKLEENYSYSNNRNFTGIGSVSLLFDMPKGGAGPFYATVTYAEKKYEFEVK